MKLKHILVTVFSAAGAVFTFRYFMDKKAAPKLSNSTVVSTDPSGNKVIEVTGVGGVDNGKKVQGYALPTNEADATFPLKVIVLPNQNIFGDWMFTVGKTLTLNKGMGSMVTWEGSGNQAGTYLISYDELKQKALKAVS